MVFFQHDDVSAQVGRLGRRHHAGPAADWRIIHRMMHIVGPVAQVVRLDLQQSLGLGFAHQAEVHHLKVFGEHAHDIDLHVIQPNGSPSRTTLLR